jgi:hypothetical protein
MNYISRLFKKFTGKKLQNKSNVLPQEKPIKSTVIHKSAETNKKINKKSNKMAIIKTAKQKATDAHEPWVDIINLSVDFNDMANGSIELDWNDIFIARLVKAGYKGKNDKEIVDQWIQDVCYNIVIGTYENEVADPDKRKFIEYQKFLSDQVESSNNTKITTKKVSKKTPKAKVKR